MTYDTEGEILRALTIIAANNTDEQQSFPIFSIKDQEILESLRNQQKVDLRLGESDYDFLMKTCVGNPIRMNKLRYQVDNVEQFEKPITHNYHHPTGHSVSNPFLPLDYLHQAQMHAYLVVIPDFQLSINGLEQVDIRLNPKEKVVLTFMETPSLPKTESEFDTYTTPITVENLSPTTQIVELFNPENDYFDHDEVFVSVDLEHSSYKEVLKEFKTQGEMRVESHKIYCAKNPQQLELPMLINDKETIPAYYHSKKGGGVDLLDFVVDMDSKFTIKPDKPIKVQVMPKTKVIYLFRRVVRPLNWNE